MFTAGDSLQFQRSLPDFPASAGWSLHYVLTSLAPQSGIQVAQFDSTASGDYHAVSVDGFAAGLDAGDYLLSGYAVNGAERHRIYYAELTIAADLSDGGASQAVLTTHAQRMITILEAQMEQVAAHVLQETDVQKSRFVWAKRSEILDLLNFYRERRAYELKVQAVANGQGNPNRIVPAFYCG